MYVKHLRLRVTSYNSFGKNGLRLIVEQVKFLRRDKNRLQFETVSTTLNVRTHVIYKYICILIVFSTV